MQTQNKRNTQFMIAKEVFIEHILGQIEQDYEINAKCLGEGGFGQVFEGKKRNSLDQQINKDLLGSSFTSIETCSRSGADWQNCHDARAIKRISYKRTEDKELMQNEIEILSYLDHPLIVRLYETYEHKKDLYLVLDLLKGGDLFTVINEKDIMSESQAKVVFLQLIKAISYLHTQHICHRDLKLENIIFLDKHSFNLKIIDFGLAFCWDQNMKKELRQKGLHKKTTGTSDYMSPEMLSQNYDERCDIWAAGVILYILLSGSPPFQGQTEKQVLKKIKSISYDFNLPEFNNVSASAKDLIAKILKPESERISVAQILNHPWLKETQISFNDNLETVTVNQSSATKFMSLTPVEMSKNDLNDKQIFLQKRKSSSESQQDSQVDTKCKSQCSDDFMETEKPFKLTSRKLNNYKKLSKLQKLQAIYSVSKISELRIKKYGEEFLIIDQDNDGSVSLKDLEEYMLKEDPFMQKEQIEEYFNELTLSRRDCISYSEYLACVLSYESDSNLLFSNEILDFDESSVEICKSSSSNDRVTFIDSIDIFDDSMLSDFFCSLDKDDDGFISKDDFIELLEKNGIESENHGLIEQISAKLTKKFESEVPEIKKKEEKNEWFIDPRTYKWQLSRTYKGESDGGIMIDFQQFKHLMISSQRCLM